MNKKTLEVLQTFCDRVEAVEKSAMAPMPAQDIDESEIISALYVLVKEQIQKANRLTYIK